MRRLFRFRFRLPSLFWAMLVVAAFFVGRSSDDIWLRFKSRGSARGVPAQLTLQVGRSKVITFSKRSPKIQINNPDVCGVVALSDRVIWLVGKAQGASQVNVWQEGSATPTTIEVSVRK